MLTAAAAGIYMGIANILHPLHNRIIYTAKPHEGTGSCCSYLTASNDTDTPGLVDCTRTG